MRLKSNPVARALLQTSRRRQQMLPNRKNHLTRPHLKKDLQDEMSEEKSEVKSI